MISLIISGIPCVLPADTDIQIQEETPLFSDSGSFSYPIEMSVAENRQLFHHIDSEQGDLHLASLDGLPFELWFDGMKLLVGITEMDDEVDIDADSISINLISGNAEFKSRIEGMKCCDVPLKDEIEIGLLTEAATIQFKQGVYFHSETVLLDPNYTMNMVYNIDKPYPAAKYCNVRLCTERSDDYDPKIDPPYWVYDAARPWSGVCFYVAYFLDCLFAHLNIAVGENHTGEVVDFNRLAFFTTRCAYTKGNSSSMPGQTDLIGFTEGLSAFVIKPPLATPHFPFEVQDVSFWTSHIYATKDNFPNEDVSSLIDSLFNAFGIKMVSDSETGKVDIYYLRDLFRNQEVADCPLRVLSKQVSHRKVHGVTLTYGEDESNTAFHYTDWKRIKICNNYNEAKADISMYDKSLRIDRNTGNKYRIKINGQAEKEGKAEQLFPALFEVAQFNDYTMGSEHDDNETLSIDFTPVIENDVTGAFVDNIEGASYQRTAIFVGEEMTRPRMFNTSPKDNNMPGKDYFERVQDFVASNSKQKESYFHVAYNKVFNYDRTAHDDCPFQTHDSGLTLGIMRGTGNSTGIETFITDYDGNGNNAWVTVAAGYAFTADTMDAYGNRYDYNGEAEGGVSDEGRISLKLHVQTEKDVEQEDPDLKWHIDEPSVLRRGLADQFMSEYLYFLKNRKTVSFEVETTLAQIRSIDWLKRVRIGDTVGWLKSRQYTLTQDGVVNMRIELYVV